MKRPKTLDEMARAIVTERDAIHLYTTTEGLWVCELWDTDFHWWHEWWHEYGNGKTVEEAIRSAWEQTESKGAKDDSL